MLKKIREDLKAAMKNGEKDTLNALRNLISKIKTKEIDKGETLNKEECLKVCMSAAKQLKDSISQFKNGGREDLAKKEEIELAIINIYLPDQISDDKIISIIQNVMQNVNAEGPSDMGKVMGPVMSQLAGQADGAHVQKLVLKELNQ